MEFTYVIGNWAIVALLVGSIAFGVGVQLIGHPGFGYEWLITALATAVGAFGASEFIVGFRTWEPIFDGAAIVPAIAGGFVVGVVVAIATRFLTSGTVQTHAAA